MFDSIASKITSTVRNVVRAVGAAFNKAPIGASLALLALFLL